MTRSLFAFSALLLTCAVLAAPAPEPFVSGWSNPLDPDRDCKIRRLDGVLTIAMPGSDHDYDPIRERWNAPRLLRDMEGDFAIQVRVRIDSQPSARSTVKGLPSFVSAGFLLIYPEKGRFICDRMEFGVSQNGIGIEGYSVAPVLPARQLGRASRKGTGADGFSVMKSWYCKKQNLDKIWDRERLEQFHVIWDCGWQDWPLLKKADSVYLRLEQRNGGDYYFLMSPDGEKWTRLIVHSGPPAKLKLGLAAYSTSPEPSKVIFDQLKLARGEKNAR